MSLIFPVDREEEGREGPRPTEGGAESSVQGKGQRDRRSRSVS